MKEEKIDSNESSIDFIKDNIRDAQILKISFLFENYEKKIVIDLVQIGGQSNKIRLEFEEVQFISFYDDEGCIVEHYVEYFKLFKNGDSYYFSIDPYDEEEKVNSDDNCVIVAKKIKGYVIE